MSLSITPGLINPKQSKVLLVGHRSTADASSSQLLYSTYYYSSAPQESQQQQQQKEQQQQQQQHPPRSVKRRFLSINDNDNDNFDNDDNAITSNRKNNNTKRYQHYYVLPVLLFEFTALALTRAVLPSILLHQFSGNVYIVMGCTDFIRGLLAFIACPFFGKLSDILGRRLCLFITVLGTCAPVCSLAFFQWNNGVMSIPSSTTIPTTSIDDGGANELPYPIPLDGQNGHDNNNNNNNHDERWKFDIGSVVSGDTSIAPSTSNPYAIIIFIILLALSGIFSSTFTLVFAYISDTVTVQEERVSAYGLALATFGLSFTIGPMLGGYLAHANIQYVFITSCFLTVIDLLYIYIVLPESKPQQHQQNNSKQRSNGVGSDEETFLTSTPMDMTSGNSVLSILSSNDISWNPIDSIQLVLLDPFLKQVGKVALLYYTGLWAIISTLSVYAVKQFHLTPNRLGELMSALGLSTMIAEAVLVRIIVPMVGEKISIKIGLISFALQCIVLGLAYQPWHLFICALFSMLGNLVYPSLSSLVSGNVEPEMVGEALGALNGIKALTEGIGPLVFGTLMTLSEHSSIPGWPYLLAAGLVLCAYKETNALPDDNSDNVDDEYIHELDRKFQRQQQLQHLNNTTRYYTSTTPSGVNVSVRNNTNNNNHKTYTNKKHDTINKAEEEEDDDEVITCVNTVVDVVTSQLLTNRQPVRRRILGYDNDEEIEALLLSEVDEDDC